MVKARGVEVDVLPSTGWRLWVSRRLTKAAARLLKLSVVVQLSGVQVKTTSPNVRAQAKAARRWANRVLASVALVLLAVLLVLSQVGCANRQPVMPLAASWQLTLEPTATDTGWVVVERAESNQGGQR